MAKRKTVEEHVKGGVISRDAETGRLVSVRTANGVSRPSEESRRVIDDISRRRSTALERLANR